MSNNNMDANGGGFTLNPGDKCSISAKVPIGVPLDDVVANIKFTCVCGQDIRGKVGVAGGDIKGLCPGCGEEYHLTISPARRLVDGEDIQGNVAEGEYGVEDSDGEGPTQVE